MRVLQLLLEGDRWVVNILQYTYSTSHVYFHYINFLYNDGENIVRTLNSHLYCVIMSCHVSGHVVSKICSGIISSYKFVHGIKQCTSTDKRK